jgi:hypothetical protein
MNERMRRRLYAHDALAFCIQCDCRIRNRFEAGSPAELFDRGLAALADCLSRRQPGYWPGVFFRLNVLGRGPVRERCLALSIPADVARAGEWLDEHAARLWAAAGRLSSGRLDVLRYDGPGGEGEV